MLIFPWQASGDHTTDSVLSSINYYLRNSKTFPLADGTLISQIIFEFKPLKTVPVNGLIKIRIPSGFSFNPSYCTNQYTPPINEII